MVPVPRQGYIVRPCALTRPWQNHGRLHFPRFYFLKKPFSDSNQNIAAKKGAENEPELDSTPNLLRALKRLLGLTKLPRQKSLEARERRENAASPFIKYPLVTHDQMRRLATDKFRFDVGYALYAHHSLNSAPTVHSLSDLTDPTQLNSLLPRRRPHGLPVDTLSIKAGDDAMLVLPSVVAIADGVSGWDSAHALLGIWARLMLETLSRLMTEYKLSHAPHTMNARDIKQVLDDSFLHTSHLMDLQRLGGSSTLVWGMLSGSTLKYVSIGDSRLFVVRNGLIVCTNTELAEDLYPQQIGTQTLNKLPSDMAVVDEFGLQEHDLVVVCSDGVTDNLFEWEILDLLQSHLSMETPNLRAVCSKILAQCKLVAFDDNAYTPYNAKVNKLPSKFGALASLGGKMDDMSLCIARVVPNSQRSA